GHSQLKTGHPVRSAIHKQLNGRLVLRWVTTWESLLLYVFLLPFDPAFSMAFCFHRDSNGACDPAAEPGAAQLFTVLCLQGMQYPREGDAFQAKDYAYFNQQYASSSYQKEHDMNPALIVQPKDDDDVVRAVRWAREQKVAVAVKSGGHQYSGASSTGGKNIQIDLTNTYKDMKVLPSQNLPEDRALVFVGVSNQLQDFNAYLKHNELFVPHGQCAYVCVGGHGQTGGYGQLGRSFGLFGDHIVGIRMVDYNGDVKEVTEQSDSELFNAIRGGSPGNFGIITHYVVNVYQAKSYIGQVAGPNGIKGPYGLKGIWL
ncbi:FAD-binding domain-containing protein, partial [Aureobasidium melanogenum]